MWINFVNLCSGDVEEIITGEETRGYLNVLCQPNAAHLRQFKIAKQDAWVVCIETDSHIDPKLQFLDQEKAKECYANLVSLIATPPDNNFIELDALKVGAI